MMEKRDKQLLDAFQAYRQVLLTHPTQVGAQQRRPYTDVLWEIIEERISGSSLELLRKVWAASINGLNSARKGEHDKACFHFNDARCHSRVETMTREAYLLALSVRNAAEAYLMHRLNKFDEAAVMVRIALDADEELERCFGYELLIGHRIQLVHNAMRVAVKRKNYEQASVLLGTAIAFMEGYGHDIPLHHSWVTQRMSSDTGWEIMERQLITELATTLPTNHPTAWLAFRDAIQWDRFLEEGHLDELSKSWVILKDHYENKRFETFLVTLPAFLEKAFTQSTSLFYAVLIDLLMLASRMGTPIASALHVQLLRDSLKWQPPKAFHKLLDHARGELGEIVHTTRLKKAV